MRVVAAMALLLLTGCSASVPREAAELNGNASVLATPSRAIAALPAELAGFRRTGPITDYEQLPGGAGLGASARYVPIGDERMVATVYIYDRGQPRRVDGGDSPEVAQELRSVAAEMNAMALAGRYRSVASAAARPGGEALGTRCTNFRVVQQNGALTGDSACVSVQRGAFVKVRLTAWTQTDPAVAGRVAAGLLSAVLDARNGGIGGQAVLRSASLAIGQP